MSRNLSRKIPGEVSREEVGWDTAIRDTEEEIRRTKERLCGLRAALRVFKERKESGEPFPGEGESQSESEAA